MATSAIVYLQPIDSCNFQQAYSPDNLCSAVAALGLDKTLNCVIAGAFYNFLHTLTGSSNHTVGPWSKAIGKAFLEPYGLNSDASTVTAAGTLGNVHQPTAGLPAHVDVYTYRPTSTAADGATEHR